MMSPSGLAVLGKSGLGTGREGGGEGGAARDKREREKRERERAWVRAFSVLPPSSCARMRSDTRGRDGGVKECRLTRAGHVQGRRIVTGQCLQNAGYFRYRFRRKVCGC